MRRTLLAVAAACCAAPFLPSVSAALTVRPFLQPTGSAVSNLGWSVSATGDLNGDGYSDIVVGAPGTFGPLIGGANVYFGGPAADAVPDVELAGADPLDYFGYSVGTAGDMNGDGYPELVVGAFGASQAVPDAGAAFVYFGGPQFDGTPDLVLSGPASGAQFGYSVAPAGDVNLDGFDDLIVGAPFANLSGAAYVFHGGAVPNATPDVTLQGTSAYDSFGASVASAGDVNGDGTPDVIVGAPGADPSGQFEAGVATVYAGTRGGPFPAFFAAYTYSTSVAGDQTGLSVAGIGDANGDGYDDVAVGAPYANTPVGDAGMLCVILGAASTADFVPVPIIRPGNTSDNFGYAVASVGDLNGDGFPDLGAGAPYRDRIGGTDVGSVVIYFMGPSFDTTADLVFEGSTPSGQLGTSVGSAGDMSGDGFGDLVLGAPGFDADPPTSDGKVFVWEVFPFRILAPNGGEQWVAGRSATVRWLGHDPAEIALSTDGGLSWDVLASGVGGATENEWSVLVPPAATAQAIVRVSYAGLASGVSDRSDAPFRIVLPSTPRPVALRQRNTGAQAAAFDHLSASGASAGDVNADGYPDFVLGAPGDDGTDVDAGRAFVYFGGPEADAIPDLVLYGQGSSDFFGASVAGIGDYNRDTYDDVAVGAPGSDIGGSNSGCVFLFYGGPFADGFADALLVGVPGEALGSSLAAAGDVNGDGNLDLVTGAPENAAAGAQAGRAYVYLGGPGAGGAPAMVLSGAAAGDLHGASVASAGDMNGDGFGDVLVGAPNNDAGGSDAGRAFAYFGGRTPDSGADLVITGEFPGDNLGAAVAGAGDFDGDGYSDAAVGAPLHDGGASDGGRALVYFGGLSPDAVPDAILTAASAGDHFGAAVAYAGDSNADGFSDLLIGAPLAHVGGTPLGRAYLYLGGPGVDLIPDAILTGQQAFDAFGTSLAGVGDTRGDGFADFLVGAPDANGGDIDTGVGYAIDCNRYFLDSPNGGETWNVGASRTISWLGAEPADVWLSPDGGATFERLASGVGGGASNSFVVRVPHVPTRFALVRVSPADPVVGGADASDSLFTIRTSVSLLFLLAAPAPNGEPGAVLSWSTDPGLGELAGYTLERSRGGGWTAIVSRIAATAFHDRDGLPGDRYRLLSVNGLGEDQVLGETFLPIRAALTVWPIPYRGGDLHVAFSISDRGAGESRAEVGVYDVRGRLVRWIVRARYPNGYHTTTWDGRDERGKPVPAGVYFVRSRAAGDPKTVKLVVAR